MGGIGKQNIKIFLTSMDVEEDLESLLRTFDQIHQEHRNAIVEIQNLKSCLHDETERRGALQSDCDDLRKDSVRLRKVNLESLANLANKFESLIKCQDLKEELKEANDKLRYMKDEYAKADEVKEMEHRLKIEELQQQLSCCMLKNSINKTTIDVLQNDLVARNTQIDDQKVNFNQIVADGESKYRSEIQDLREWLMVEEEEKTMLSKRLNDAENEISALRVKQTERQQESISIRHVETLKQKVMKLRKENENLKRQLASK
ncbi:hypothetical protein ZOSMA_50G00530 [Zostera marina]|uniref:Uncharacterized protein n=1 Tax=Zostera marina TaxID=29655 RepID=A0A0K9NY82_ZOSMR|nr:hypothetical protein ZOSMA_50G00530 [Zostera marina]